MAILSRHHTQLQLKRLWLPKADFREEPYWVDVLAAVIAIHRAEPGQDCIRIGRDKIDGKLELVVVTQSNMYIFDKGSSGFWKLKSEGPYNY
jgi:hypothetical protein